MITNGRSIQPLLGICFAPGRAEQESKMKQTELPLLEPLKAREIERKIGNGGREWKRTGNKLEGCLTLQPERMRN